MSVHRTASLAFVATGNVQALNPTMRAQPSLAVPEQASECRSHLRKASQGSLLHGAVLFIDSWRRDLRGDRRPAVTGLWVHLFALASQGDWPSWEEKLVRDETRNVEDNTVRKTRLSRTFVPADCTFVR